MIQEIEDFRSKGNVIHFGLSSNTSRTISVGLGRFRGLSSKYQFTITEMTTLMFIPIAVAHVPHTTAKREWPPSK